MCRQQLASCVVFFWLAANFFLLPPTLFPHFGLRILLSFLLLSNVLVSRLRMIFYWHLVGL